MPQTLCVHCDVMRIRRSHRYEIRLPVVQCVLPDENHRVRFCHTMPKTALRLCVKPIYTFHTFCRTANTDSRPTPNSRLATLNHSSHYRKQPTQQKAARAMNSRLNCLAIKAYGQKVRRHPYIRQPRTGQRPSAPPPALQPCGPPRCRDRSSPVHSV